MANILRPDGRNAHELRELSISYEGLSRADGSARFGFGETKSLASVSGPIEVRLAVEHASHATFEVIVRPLASLPGTEAKSLSYAIRNLLTPSILLSHHPRTLIQLVIQSVTPTPSRDFPHPLVASLINAATLALLSAGSVPMRGIVCAVSIGRLLSPAAANPSVTLILDPSDGELSALGGGGCFAFLFAADANQQGSAEEKGNLGSGLRTPCEVVWSYWYAATPFDDDEFVRARELAKMGAGQVWLKIKFVMSMATSQIPALKSAQGLKKPNLESLADGRT